MTTEGRAGRTSERYLVMAGVSHRSASLPLLERLAIDPDRLPELFGQLRSAGCDEAVVLSTCSRTEIYATTSGSATMLVEALLRPVGVPEQRVPSFVQQRNGRAAVAHLLHVAAGLDSRLPGEVEIQGQVRAAARFADGHGVLGPQLREAFSAAVATARKAHRETALGSLGRSLGRCAVDAAVAASGHPHPRTAVVGAGRMARTAIGRLLEMGVQPLVYARDPASARRLPPVEFRPLEDLPATLRTTDVVVVATSAHHHLLRTSEVEPAVAERRADRPLVVVDLGVPRNVEPSIGGLRGTNLLDLEQFSDDRRPEDVESALAEASAIVQAALRALDANRRRRNAAPMLARLHVEAEEACRRLLVRSRPELATAGELDRIARTTSRRLVHRSIGELLDALEGEGEAGVEQIVRAFTAEDADALVAPELPALRLMDGGTP